MFGCSKSEASKSASETQGSEITRPTIPEKDLYEQCRSGVVLINGVLDSIEEATCTSEKLKSQIAASNKDVYEEFFDLIDSAGARLTDYATPFLDFEAFKRDIVPQNERRLNMIAATNDAKHELDEASDILEDLSGKLNPKAKPDVDKLIDLLELSIEGLEDAIQALGGKVEE